MSEYLPVIISIVGAIVAIAVAWGANAAKMDENSRWRADMEKKLESCASKEHCSLKHEFVNQVLTDIRVQLKEIKDLIKELSDK